MKCLICFSLCHVVSFEKVNSNHFVLSQTFQSALPHSTCGRLARFVSKRLPLVKQTSGYASGDEGLEDRDTEEERVKNTQGRTVHRVKVSWTQS